MIQINRAIVMLIMEFLFHWKESESSAALQELKDKRIELLLPGLDMKLVWATYKGYRGWAIKTYSHSYGLYPEMAMADLFARIVNGMYPNGRQFKTAILPIYENHNRLIPGVQS